MLKSLLPIVTAFATAAAAAASPADLLQAYTAEARQASAGFTASPGRGEAFFRQERATANGSAACTGCHTDDPRKEGRTRARKPIAPMAPAANPERLTDSAKSEKWFGRNCQDVLGRACTAAEKADVAAYLISIR